MNYEPNLTHWKVNDLVIHDYDAKEPYMLMRVSGFTRDGYVKTRYLYDYKNKNKKDYPHPMHVLHDPERFNIPTKEVVGLLQEDLDKYQNAFTKVRLWNHYYNIGQKVRTTSGDGGFDTVTTSIAFMRGYDKIYVELEQGGLWDLQFVELLIG